MIRPLTARSYHLPLTILALLAGGILLLLSALSPLQAQPAAPHDHSWYDGECCNKNDCVPIYGAIKERRDGYYIVTLDTLIPYGDKRIRQSKDFDFHVCVIPETAADPKLRNTIRCLYVPGRGA